MGVSIDTKLNSVISGKFSFLEWCKINDRNDLLKLWDYEKNPPISPESISYASNKKINWKCEKGHEWVSTICNQRKKKKCSFCSGRNVIKGENDFETWCKKTNHDRILEEWLFDLNEKRPDEITTASHYNAWWRCSKCGRVWRAEVRNRVRFCEGGCLSCAGKESAKKRVINEIAKKGSLFDVNRKIWDEWDYEKNELLTPKDVLPNSNKKVWWRCPLGHSYRSSITSRFSKGNGCPICSNKVVLEGFNDLNTTFPLISSEWDYERNVGLSPYKIVAGSNKKVWWICSDCGYNWEATVVSRTTGHSCPRCSVEKKSSFPEQAVLFYMKKVFFDVVSNDREVLNGKELDIYISSIKLAIEYDGKNWHQNIERDLEKNALCKKNGIHLVRIRERGCPRLEDDSITTYEVKYEDYQQLGEVIGSIFKELNKTDVSIDINKDRSLIYGQYLSKIKAQSIAFVFPELLSQWDYAANGDLKPDRISIGSHKKIFWKCENGHSYQQRIRNKIIGQGCPICNNSVVLAGYNDFETWCKNNNRKDLLNDWDYKKNKLKPNEILPGTEIEIWWNCSLNHSYKSLVYNRRKGVGCPYCSVPAKKVLKGFNDLQTRYPEIATEWDYEKNGDLSPDKILYGSAKKVWWKCSKGHTFKSMIATRVNGYGCPICGSMVGTRKVILVDTNEVFDSITLAAKKYNTNPSSISMCCGGHLKTAGGFHWKYFENNIDKVDFETWCRDNDREDLLDEWNYTENKELAPNMVSKGSHKSVSWHCKQGHVWNAPIRNRVRGTKCPFCRTCR